MLKNKHDERVKKAKKLITFLVLDYIYNKENTSLYENNKGSDQNLEKNKMA